MGCLDQKSTEESSQDNKPLIEKYHNEGSKVEDGDEDVVIKDNLIIRPINKEEDNYEYMIKNSKTLCEYSYKKVDISDKNNKATQRIFEEIEILKKIDHPNIIKFYEANISKNNKYIELVTELPEEGDLQEKLDDYECDYKCFRENELLDWLNQICFALKHIHSLNILHRNIKPSSIFLMNRGYAKLGDFGMAKIVNKKGDLKRVKTFMPKAQYAAPEILEKKDFTEKTDIWLLGVTFFQLMTFKFPFKGDNDKEKMKSILDDNKNDFTFSYSKDFKDLITRMLSKDPNKRPTADEILEMPFMRKRMESYVDENENEFVKLQDDIFGMVEEIESDDENDIKEKDKISEIKVAENIKQSNNKEFTKEDNKINDKKENDKDDKEKTKKKVIFNLNEEEIKKISEDSKKKKARKSAFDFVRQLENIKQLIKK